MNYLLYLLFKNIAIIMSESEPTKSMFELTTNAIAAFKSETTMNGGQMGSAVRTPIINELRNNVVNHLDDIVKQIDTLNAKYKAMNKEFKKANNAYYRSIATENEAKRKADECAAVNAQLACFEGMREQFEAAFKQANTDILAQEAIILQTLAQINKGDMTYNQYKMITNECIGRIHEYTCGKNEVGKIILEARKVCLCRNRAPIEYAQIAPFDLYGRYKKGVLYNNGYNGNNNNLNKYVLMTKKDTCDKLWGYRYCHCTYKMCNDCKMGRESDYDACHYCFPPDCAGN